MLLLDIFQSLGLDCGPAQLGGADDLAVHLREVQQDVDDPRAGAGVLLTVINGSDLEDVDEIDLVCDLGNDNAGEESHADADVVVRDCLVAPSFSMVVLDEVSRSGRLFIALFFGANEKSERISR